MLARAQTSNVTTWASRLGVLGLAALLSPSTPVRAQVGDFDPPRNQHRLEEPDKPDRSAAAADHRDAAERLEAHLKDLAERLGKEVSPFTEEVRKAIEQAAGTVNEALKKDDVTSDDFREALERAGEELRRSFRSGGPVDREAREAWDKAQDELRASLDKAREEARAALRDRAGDLDRDPFAGDGPVSDDLSKARNQVRDIQRQLRAAMRNLEQLERREAEARRAPRRGPDANRNRNRPRPPAPPTPPSPPAEADRPGEPAARRFFRGPGAAAPNPRADRRLNDLESKMDRLLEELKELKKEKDQKKDKDGNDDQVSI